MSYSDRFDRALTLASALHRDQTRKGSTVPYITHLLAVASIVGEYGGSEDEVIAALLHDAVEDQGGAETRKRIEAEFGPAVAAIVDGCTDTDQEPKPPWQARKQQFLDRLETASPSVLRVAVADKIHNARSLLADLRHPTEDVGAVWGKSNGGREGTLWYYQQLCECFSRRLPGPCTEELLRIVAEIRRLAVNLPSG